MKQYLQECLAAAIALAIFSGCAWWIAKLSDADWLTAFTVVSVYCIVCEQLRDSRRSK